MNRYDCIATQCSYKLSVKLQAPLEFLASVTDIAAGSNKSQFRSWVPRCCGVHQASTNQFSLQQDCPGSTSLAKGQAEERWRNSYGMPSKRTDGLSMRPCRRLFLCERVEQPRTFRTPGGNPSGFMPAQSRSRKGHLSQDSAQQKRGKQYWGGRLRWCRWRESSDHNFSAV